LHRFSPFYIKELSMTLRSQTIALIVLFAAVGIVFVFVADADISTRVFTPDSTLTPTATTIPTATSAPAPEEVWTETQPGTLAYAADPALQVQLIYRESTVETFVTQLELQPPAADTPFPLLNLLGQMRTAYESQAAEVQLSLEADAFTGPSVELIDGLPVTLLRLQIAPQTLADGRDFPGMDVAQVLVDKGGGSVVWIQFMLQGEQNPAVWDNFRAWLAAKLPEFSTPAEAEATPGADETTSSEPPADATAVPTSEGDTATEPAAAPTVEATVEPSPEPTQPLATEVATTTP
jgi:hypothetical protein